jgi:hypothetical protein
MPDYFSIKRGDTSPSIRATLKDAAGQPIPLTGASVRFHMRAKGAADVTVDAAAAIVDPDGEVRYDWEPGDTASAGWHEAEWEVTYADGAVETFPNRGSTPILIDPDLA